MRAKNGRSSGAIRRSTRRADSSRSVPCAKVIVKTPSCHAHCRAFRAVGSLDKGGPAAIFNPQVEYMATPVLDLAFAALSDPTRREIVQRLAKGAARVTDLA